MRIRLPLKRASAQPVATLMMVLSLMLVGTPFLSATSAAAQSDRSLAYVWANDPLAESYTPDERYQYNSTGVLNTITRTDVGRYTVTMPGMSGGNGNVQITATSGTNEAAPFAVGHHCFVAGKATGSDFQVKCLGTGGTPVDTGFMMLYVKGDVFLGWNTAYVFADQETADSYTVEGAYQYNQHGLPNTITRTAPGEYAISLGGVGMEEGVIQVTAITETGTVCSPGWWEIDESNNKIVHVYCYNAAGEMVDSWFGLWHGSAVTANSPADAWEVWPRGASLMVNHYHDEGQYVPGMDFQFNSAGLQNEAVWTSTGTYDVIMPGVFIEGGVFQVTAFEDGTGVAACNTFRWGFEGEDGVRVTVKCFDAAGAPVDSPFYISYTTTEP